MNEAIPSTGEAPAAPPVSAFDFMLQADAAAAGSADETVPTTTPSVLDFSDRPERTRPRASPLEWVALVLAVVAPPLGLVSAIAARIVASRTHGWITRVLSIATVVSIVLTVVVAAGAVVSTLIGQSEAAHDAIIAESAPFCAALDETPGVLDLPGYGWPTERLSIPDSIVAMQAYQERWAGLAAIAPDGVRPGVRSVSDAAQSLTNSLVTTQVIDRERNLEQISVVTRASGVPAYVAKYCG
jgi:hypothetical protein